MRYQSWGRYPKQAQRAREIHWHDQPLPQDRPLLPFGNGRSYGDVCLNDGGLLLDTRPLDRFLAFDPREGVLRCEAGVLLSEILDFIVPKGWFLPVTPGTRFVTLGGAVANDVHGKNHHCAGNFSHHVRAFELRRSDGSRRVCLPTDEWFRASVGGLGLTGLMTWVEIQLTRIPGPFIRQEVMRYRDLDEFFELSAASARDFEYTVAWLDCLGRGKGLGRGLFIRGNAVENPRPAPCVCRKSRLSVPLEPPFSLINPLSLKLFNLLYYYRQSRHWRSAVVDYAPFFYPLDAIGDWNRIYGPRGFLQYQCVLPPEHGQQAMKEVLRRIAEAGVGSFLAVLKVFGERPALGLLSFPRPGVTVALDFPNAGPKTFALLDRLDEITADAGGAVYPAKDARMSAAHFRQYFPAWQEFTNYIDPAFSSSFWRRTGGQNE